jgi:xanthine dehydrogenase molybdenum-binding subunit
MVYQYIGKEILRVDDSTKLTGEALYVGDLKRPGMLYATVLRSPHAHALIEKVATEKALKLPGVKAVIEQGSLAANFFSSAGHPYPDDCPLDCRILDQKVRFVGDAVAAIAAESREAAEKAASLLEVVYRKLPAYFSPEEALAEGATEIHDSSGNLCAEYSYHYGDVKGAFSGAEYLFEDEISTPAVTHCALERHVSLSYLEGDLLVVHSSTQIPFTLRRIMGLALCLPLGRIRILQSLTGGGFGGKQDVTLEPIGAALTMKTGRPVLIEYSREESLVSTRTRHAMKMKLRTALNAEGRFTARELELLSNTGAYSSHGPSVAINVGNHFSPLYPVENLRYRAKTAYTNMPVAGAMRAYGIPQLTMAVEAHVDNIARRMGMDALELRRKNLCQAGHRDRRYKITVNSCGIGDCFEQGLKVSDWQKRKDKAIEVSRSDEPVKRGLGLACFNYASCTWPGQQESAGARVRIEEDGSAILSIGSVEIGQGNNTVMVQIAAETLGIPVEKIRVEPINTDNSPYDQGAYASRQVYVSGKALEKAASQCRVKLLQKAALFLKCDCNDLTISDGWIMAGKKKLATVGEIALQAKYRRKRAAVISAESFHSADTNALSFGLSIAEVEVDTETGKVEVLNLWNIHDSGQIINPLLASGQVEGGMAMSYGYALLEELIIDQDSGKVLNAKMGDYKIPTALDLPPLFVHFVHTDEASGCYGAKSLGEPPTISPAPAIRNAVVDAIGIEVNSLPLTPEKILNLLEEKAPSLLKASWEPNLKRADGKGRVKR